MEPWLKYSKYMTQVFGGVEGPANGIGSKGEIQSSINTGFFDISMHGESVGVMT